MKIDESCLEKGEKIVYRGKMHWIVYSGSLLWAFFGIAIVHQGERHMTLGGIFLLVAIVSGILSVIKMRTAFYIVTSKSVTIGTGVFYRLSFELPLKKIGAVIVEQNRIGRHFDYGTVVICGTGGTRDAFHRVAAPNEFKRIVDSLLRSSREE